MTNFYIQVEKIPDYISSLIINSDNVFWKEKLKNDIHAMLHLAVMVQPYLSRILDGEKTIESRYSVNMVAPFRKIKTGDIILLKKSGGEVVALFEAGKVRYFQMTSCNDLLKIKSKYNDRLVIEDAFWEAKRNSRFATLIDIQELLLLPQFKINKKSRTAWMTLGFMQEEQKQMTINCYPPIICIAGKIASGKTFVSKLIAQRKSGIRYSTSDYLKYKLHIDGISNPTREQLQQQGKIEIDRGWHVFAQSVLDHLPVNNSKNLVVIDGVRHLQFYRAIKSLIYPQKCSLIYLKVADDIIQKRLIERNELDIAYDHVAEGNLKELEAVADYVFSGNISEIEECIDKLYSV